MIRFIGIFGLILSFSCNSTDLNKTSAQNYYDLLASQEILKAENYLSDDFRYEDVIFKQEYTNRSEFLNSLAIDTAKHYSCDKILKIENIDADNDSMVYIIGEYCGFTYKTKEVAPMRFMSVLYYNKNGKIKRQEDWIDHSLEGILSMYQFRNSMISGN